MRYLFLAFFLWSTAAFGQIFPDYQSTTVNDFADLLTDQEEAALSAQLTDLRQETGVEMTVLTLATRADYAPEMSMEQFATALFNHWGIGDADRNDGVLVMVLPDDRAIRIELGAAFGRNWDRTAEQVIDTYFLDSFAAGNYSQGITEGTSAIIAEIVRPFLAGSDAPDSGASEGFWPVLLIALAIAASSSRRALGDFFARFRACPNCGRQGIRQNRRVTKPATRTMTGQGIRSRRCRFCDYHDDFEFVIPVRSSSSSSGFGGGSSGGGGASGRW